MDPKNNQKTMGAVAPQKRPIFSINVDRQGVRVQIVNNAPQQEQEIGRVRGD